MRPLAFSSLVLAFFAFPGLPAVAQLYGQGMTSYSSSLGAGMDHRTQGSRDRTGFDSTLDFLQRKAEEEAERQERQMRQRRMTETVITNRPEQILDSYFSRSTTPYDRR